MEGIGVTDVVRLIFGTVLKSVVDVDSSASELPALAAKGLSAKGLDAQCAIMYITGMKGETTP